MTTIAASPLTDALQALVDARLDTIDRMLLGRVNRHDRLAIVREVESQVFDLLGRHEGGPIDRDDVLAVLARLDPPEAYLPEDGSTAEPGPIRRPGSAQPTRPVTVTMTETQGRLELVSGILGMVSMVIVFFACLLVFVLEIGDELLFAIAIVPTFVISLLAVIFAARVRLRGGWSIVGFVTGLLVLLLSVCGGGWMLTLFL